MDDAESQDPDALPDALRRRPATILAEQRQRPARAVATRAELEELKAQLEAERRERAAMQQHMHELGDRLAQVLEVLGVVAEQADRYDQEMRGKMRALEVVVASIKAGLPATNERVTLLEGALQGVLEVQANHAPHIDNMRSFLRVNTHRNNSYD